MSVGAQTMHLGASVLCLRGEGVTRQPFSANGLHFAWNGEVFDGSEGAWVPGENDGAALFQRLVEKAGNGDVRAALVAALAEIEGPYAFVLVDVRTEADLGGASLCILRPRPARAPVALAVRVAICARLGLDPRVGRERLGVGRSAVRFALVYPARYARHGCGGPRVRGTLSS